MKNIFALVDCNNFFVSCERVFDPHIWHKPVMVLSNNDGCVVARSNEVKALGIKMGTPEFKCRDLIKKHSIKVFSSNYTLYADMSNRVMATLAKLAPEIEIYSIDEAFLSLTNTHIQDLDKYGAKIRSTIYKWTGIPVSVSIAPTKGLTKIASEFAKKDKSFHSVCNFCNFSNHEIDNLLSKVDVIDTWGVGPAYAKKLKRFGINTVRKLKYADLSWINKKLTVMGERCVLELRGISCFPLDVNPEGKKSICSSRSFGYPVTKKRELEEAVAAYTATACEKLRNQNSYANVIIVYIKTNRFKAQPQYSNAAYMKLPEPTSSTIDMTKYALYGLEQIFRQGFKYKKAGVLLEGIQPSDRIQLNLFLKYNHKLKMKENKLMKFIDRVNRHWGRGTLHLASEGVKKKWSMKRCKLSKRFTTDLDEVLEIAV